MRMVADLVVNKFASIRSIRVICVLFKHPGMMAMRPDSTETSFDPTFLHARREAWLILCAWAVCLIWTVGYCAFAAYDVPPEQIQIILGMPSWVFWGVLVPWVAATLFSVWFSLAYIADDDLGESDDEEALHG